MEDEERSKNNNNEKDEDASNMKAARVCFPEHIRNPFKKYKWLSIKVHYFLMYGAVVGVLSFMPLVGSDIGLNATTVGISYSFQPIFIFIFKPIFGYLADSLQNVKAIVMCLITGAVISLTIITFLPPLQKISHIDLEIHLQQKGKTKLYKNISSDFDEACVKTLFSLDRINCTASYQDMFSTVNLTEKSLVFDTDFNCTCNSTYPRGDCEDNKNLNFMSCFISWKSNFSETNANSYSSINCDDVFEACLVSNKHPNFLTTYQFWIFTILLVTANTFITTCMSLTDVACYDLLGKHKLEYGKQRLWAAVSVGVVTLLMGYLNDLFSRNDQKTEYLGACYMMIALFILNMMLLVYMNLPKSKFSRTIVLDMKTLFHSPDIIVYCIAVFFMGIFQGLAYNYLFWYLRELGASQTLLGLTATFQCLVGEAPFFFFAGWFIKHLSFFNCLTCSFAAFALRFGLYSILQNPWYTLPIEVFQGFTFAVFYSSKTAFASLRAPPGTEGTLLGILGGLYDGLGYAAGSFLGGFGFDRIGSNRTFQSACIMSVLCIPITLTAHFVFKKTPSH